MMRVARAGVGVDCGSATEREPWTQQRHTLTQETEDAVLVFFLLDCPLDAFVLRAVAQASPAPSGPLRRG